MLIRRWVALELIHSFSSIWRLQVDLNELEAEHRAKPIVAEFEEVDDEEQAIIDVKEGINLIGTSMTMFNYLSNPMLCRTLSKRERDIMGGLAEQLRKYLASVEPTYSEDDDEES